MTAEKYTRREDYLKRGDILVSEGHHTVINLTNGRYATSKSPAIGKVEDARNFDKSLAGKYTVTTDLNMRLGAGKDKLVSGDHQGGRLCDKQYLCGEQHETDQAV